MRRLALALVLALSTPALAQPSAAPDTLTAEARRRFDEGLEALGRGENERARVAFLQVQALKPDVPEVLSNLGLAEVRSGRDIEGARHLAGYLRGPPGKMETPRARSEILAALADAETRLGRLAIAAPNGAELLVGGEIVGRAPLGYDVHVAPGAVRIVARAGGRELERTVVAAAGKRELVALTAPSSEPPVAPAPESAMPPPRALEPVAPIPPESHGSARIPVVLAGAGLTIAAGVAAGVFVGKASSDRDEARRMRDAARGQFGAGICADGAGAGSADCRGAQDKLDSANSAGTVATIALVATGALAAGTLTAFVLWPRARDISAAPALAPGYAGIYGAVRF